MRPLTRIMLLVVLGTLMGCQRLTEPRHTTLANECDPIVAFTCNDPQGGPYVPNDTVKLVASCPSLWTIDTSGVFVGNFLFQGGSQLTFVTPNPFSLLAAELSPNSNSISGTIQAPLSIILPC